MVNLISGLDLFTPLFIFGSMLLRIADHAIDFTRSQNEDFLCFLPYSYCWQLYAETFDKALAGLFEERAPRQQAELSMPGKR